MTEAGAAGPLERPTVAIGLLTYRRPHDLRDALPQVLAQLDDAPCDGSVVVIDNDPAGSALDMAAHVRDGRVRFVHEPTPGIVAARNRALDESVGADLLVFIDDDERPEPGWLRSLVDTWTRTRAAAVMGPVVPVYPAPPEPWITLGGYFDRRRFATGTDVMAAGTGNLLLDLHQLHQAGVRFDPRFTSGGSDTLFTRELRRRGGRMVWCDEAVVLDVVPPSRLTRRWVLQRKFRSGNTWSRVALELESGRLDRTRRRFVLTAGGLARVVVGAGRFALGTVLLSMRQRARGARTLARGIGFVSGAWGHSYAEYGQPVSTAGITAEIDD